MAVERVDMFRVLCDGCGESSQEGGDYYAWDNASHAIDIAGDSGWLITDDGKHFCENCQTYDAEADEYIGVAGPTQEGTSE